ncbi:MAG: Y-family DNA polymerase [Geminicoccaceae bacterium]
MGSRVLSLWLPYLAIDRIRREAYESDGVEGPYATFAKVDGQHQLNALCPLAERARLEPGMLLHEARARAPMLKLFPSDSKGELTLLETIKTWCERYTPWVAIDRSCEHFKGASLWLDVKSAAHHFGGEVHLLTDLLERLREQGLQARAAISDHPGNAWAIARFGPEEQRILPVNGARVALASLPIQALRLDDQRISMLTEQGFDEIEPLYALPRQTLEARFGRTVVKRLDQALGLIDEPIAPTAPLPAQQAQLIFADPIMSSDALRPLIKRLVRQLSVGLEAAGLGVRRLSMAFYRVDNSIATFSIGSERPSRDIKRLSRLLADKAKTIEPGYGIERLILDAVEIEPLLPETIAWRGLGTGVAAPFRDLAPVSEPQGFERYIPHVVAVSSTDYSSTDYSSTDYRAKRISRQPPVYGNLATALDLSLERVEATALEKQPSRPLRLLRKPEPIEAIAPLPDEPPILFRWRKGLHKIVRAQGPERIAPDWWRIPDREQPSIGKVFSSKIDEERRMRDYFAVEDSVGDRFWLFREGLYRASEAALPRWYLHGVFR